MKFNTDSYIEIGKSHEICEDYALHGSIMDVPYVIISDGCSSSENTDVGSRILAHSCKNALTEIMNHNLLEDFNNSNSLSVYLKEQILFNVRLTLKALSLHTSVADATLLLAFVWEGKMYCFIYGDGHIIINYKDKPITISKVSYVDNAPPYISYNLDIRRKEGFREQFGEGMVDLLALGNNVYANIPMKDWLDSGACVSLIDNVDDIQSITLASDGIESYMYGHNALATPEERSEVSNESKWQQEYTSYKSASGEFVKRRMKRIKLNNEKQNIEHFDDVSCATIWIGHEQ